MKQTVIAMVLLTLMTLAVQAFALEVTYYPNPGDLDDLPHNKTYTWGVDISAFGGLNIYEVVLTITTVSNWDNNPNHLYIHLLDDAPLSVTVGSHSDGDFIDALAGQGPLIDNRQGTNTKDVHNTPVHECSKIDALPDPVAVYRANSVMAIAFDLIAISTTAVSNLRSRVNPLMRSRPPPGAK